MSDAAPKTDPRAPGPGLNPAQKAAVIIAALDPDQSEAMLRSLDADALQSFARAMTDLNAVPRAALEATIVEFLSTLSDRFITAGSREVKTILGRIMNAEDAERLVSRARGGETRTVWQELGDAPDADLAAFLAGEHPQTAAAILRQLPPAHAARLITRLDPAVATETVQRLSRVGEIDGPVMALLEEGVREGFLVPFGRTGDRAPADAVIGAILDSMAGERREPIMKGLEETRPDFAAAVQKRMFTFDDIPARVDVKQMPVIARVVANATLRTALAHGRARGSATVDFILANISKRLADQINEELAEGLVVKSAEGEAAQSELVGAIRALAESGEITLILPDEDE